MAKVNDRRGRPGDIVLVRGGAPIDVFRTIIDSAMDHSAPRAGVVMPGAMGLIVATHLTAWTYVLWSMPCLAGWVRDGYLRRI